MTRDELEAAISEVLQLMAPLRYHRMELDTIMRAADANQVPAGGALAGTGACASRTNSPRISARGGPRLSPPDPAAPAPTC